MADRTVSVRLQAEIGQYVSSMSKASAATLRLGNDATASGAKARSGFDLAGKGALLLGGAVVAGMGMAIGKSMDFEAAMSGAAAATQVTGAALDDLRELAIKAGGATQYSATEAAQAITEMGKAGVSTADIMSGGLDGALALAAAGQLEVGKAAEIASVAMTQFGLSGEQLPHVADLLAAGAGKAMGSVEDLGMALNQAGLIASQSGLSIEETTGTLAAFASAGLVGSDAGTSFKTMLQKLQNPSKEAAGTMAELGINMYDSQGQFVGMEALAGQLRTSMEGLTPAVRDAAMAQIFGSDAVRAANVLYKEGSAGIAEWTRKVNDQGYAAEQARALNDNLRGDLERLGGAFDTLMIEFGNGAQGPLREIVQAFTGILDVASDVLGFWSSLPDSVKIAVTAFATFTALRGPFDRLFERIAVGVTSTVTGMGMASGATTTLGIAAGTARSAISKLVAAAAPLISLTILTSAISSVMEFSKAGDSARESIRSFNDSLKDMGNTARSAAVASEIDDIRDAIEGYRATVEAYDSQGWADKHLWYVPFGGEKTDVEDARQSLEAYERQLRSLEIANQQTETATRVLADRFHLTQTEVQDLADKYEIDLAGAVWWTTLQFGQMYSKEYGSTPIDAANMLGAAVTSAKQQTEEAAKAQEEWLKSLQDIATGFVDPLNSYKALLDEKTEAEKSAAQATADARNEEIDAEIEAVRRRTDAEIAGVEGTTAAADATRDKMREQRDATVESLEDSKKSWEDYVGDVGVSLDELAGRLEEQLRAQDEWRKNIGLITQRGGMEVGQILASMGEEGVQLAAKMANGTDAEFNRMAAALIEDARRGGSGAAAEFDYYMKIMELVGASGGQATVRSVSAELGIGIAEVRRIAEQYGIQLASGFEPLLAALGARSIAIQARGSNATPNSGGTSRPGFAEGGYTGPGSKYQPAGVVHAGEYVLTQEQVNKLGINAIEAFANGAIGLPGYATGGFVSSASVPRPPSTWPFEHPISTGTDGVMQVAYSESVAWIKAIEELAAAQRARDAAAAAGAGAVGGGWQSIWNHVKAAIPQARINSTYRPGDPGYHGRGKAIDFGFGTGPGGAGSAGLASINRYLHDTIGGNLAELIYDGIGDDRPDLKNGRPLTYNAATRAEHRNHVHAAVYDQGGLLRPGFTLAYNGTGRNETIRTAGQEAALDGPMQVMLQLEGDAVTALLRGEVVETLGTRRAINAIETGLVMSGRERS